jgi:3-oxoacyl-[acyl-carrier-protein] synthase II
MSGRTGRRVAVTGVGIVSPFGGGAQDFFGRLLEGESAVRWYRHPLSQAPLEQPAVSCTDFDAELALGRQVTSVTDRFSQLGIAAALDAWKDAGLPRESGEAREDAGVCWGTGIGGTLTVERGYFDFYESGKVRASPLSVPMVMNNAAASHIAILLGMGGPCVSYSVACASSAVSIGEAYRRVRSGECSLMVAGGSEAPLSSSVMRAWEAMRVVAECNESSAPRACRPFQKGRTGLVLGEGGAALVLEEWARARARGARIYCELVGYGESCDHHHLVRPARAGQVRAIGKALQDAELAPEDVGYVNAHGAGTREGDAIEIESLAQVFGAHAAALAVSSTKSMHGHTLGAAGAIEALVTVLALARRVAPPTAHLEEVAPECQGVRHVAGAALALPRLGAALSNSFAFGGSNAVLAFRAAA